MTTGHCPRNFFFISQVTNQSENCDQPTRPGSGFRAMAWPLFVRGFPRETSKITKCWLFTCVTHVQYVCTPLVTEKVCEHCQLHRWPCAHMQRFILTCTFSVQIVFVILRVGWLEPIHGCWAWPLWARFRRAWPNPNAYFARDGSINDNVYTDNRGDCTSEWPIPARY